MKRIENKIKGRKEENMGIRGQKLWTTKLKYGRRPMKSRRMTDGWSAETRRNLKKRRKDFSKISRPAHKAEIGEGDKGKGCGEEKVQKSRLKTLKREREATRGRERERESAKHIKDANEVFCTYIVKMSSSEWNFFWREKSLLLQTEDQIQRVFVKQNDFQKWFNSQPIKSQLIKLFK